MNSIKLIVSCLIIITSSFLNAQSFLKPVTNAPYSFKEMQLQFDAWKKTVDLKEQKNWKNFKRWEMDMQMHTDAKGNPGNPQLYIDAITKAAKEKPVDASAKFTSAAWLPVGPNVLPGNLTGYMENGIGRINCIAFHPSNAATYFVGVAQGGLWKTTNNGTSWIPLTDNLPITRISDIAIDPVNPNTMYISLCDFEYIGFGLNLNGRKRNTHYGLGVYKTIDGGNTWNATGLTFQLTNGDASLIRKTIVHPVNNNKLIACGVNGVYRSNDAGATWNHVLDSLCWDLIQDPINPNVLYCATGWVANANDGYAAIYKSTDFGDTWTMLNTNIPGTGVVQRVKLAMAPSDNTCIYAMTVDINNGIYGIYKTSDAGVNWTYINPGVNVLHWDDGTGTGGQGNYDLGFNVNPTDKDVVYVGGVNVWASTDGANTFNPVSHWTLSYGPTLHGDIHFIETQPLTGNLFVCSDGGLYRTANVVSQTWNDANNGSPWPTQWTNLCSGLQISSFYRISSSRNIAGRLVAGAQDNATFYYDNGVWNTIFGGDGMDNYLDPANDDAVIGSSQYGNFYSSTDDGISLFPIDPNPNFEVSEWTTPIIADYNQPGVLYAGNANVSKSTDGGQSWSVISNFPPSGFANNEISALAVSNSNSNVIYATKRVRYEYSIPGSVYVTTDGGINWTDITLGLPDSLYYTSIDIDQNDANTAYICMAQLSAGIKVFKTTNTGSTWQNISYNLPNLPVNCVKTLPGSNILLAGTDVGVYMFNPVTLSWSNVSLGLPNAIVQDIDFNVALNKLYVCTFGRGIWETNLAKISSVPNVTAAELNIELYPTLNNGSFTISVNDNHLSNTYQLNIIDITGRLVYEATLSGQKSYDQNLNLPTGKYFAKLKNNKTSGVKSFVVE